VTSSADQDFKGVADMVFKKLASEGRMRLSDNSALLMIPEAASMSRENYLDLSKQGKLQISWRMCGGVVS
jgi:hypothetical protein